MDTEHIRALLEESSRYQDQASTILSETGVMHILEEYGKPKIVGSCAAKLMMSGDIDIEVVGGPYDLDTIMKAQRALLDLVYFSHLLFIDIRWFRNYEGSFSHGYYIGPRKKIDNEAWSLDIWFFTEEAEATNRKRGKLLISEEDVNDNQRALILQAKDLAKREGIKGASRLIYTKVLWEGVTSMEEILAALVAS